jgi:hypothetical protein
VGKRGEKNCGRLQADPTNAEVRDILSDAQEKLADVF